MIWSDYILISIGYLESIGTGAYYYTLYELDLSLYCSNSSFFIGESILFIFLIIAFSSVLVLLLSNFLSYFYSS